MMKYCSSILTVGFQFNCMSVGGAACGMLDCERIVNCIDRSVFLVHVIVSDPNFVF